LKCLFNVAVVWIFWFSNPCQVSMTTLLVESLSYILISQFQMPSLPTRRLFLMILE